MWTQMLKAVIASLARRSPRLHRSRMTGTVTVEYALLLAVLVIVGVGAWVSFGETLKTALLEVINSFNEAGV